MSSKSKGKDKSQQCTACQSTNIVSESGSSYCADCGAVLEESNIVNEITFIEGANGTSSVVGKFVSSTGSVYGGNYGRGKGRSSYSYSKESREATIENGRRKISQVAATLKLGSHHIEAAQRLFMLAVQHNFIQGRKTQNVIAACLYIVCRREKTPHLLIDFSDVLQTNVYVLGHTFLKFCRLLNLQLPIIDPSLYIARFAAKLEFEDKTHGVATTALRIVQRMKRDWIQTGRRPSGICGAALLIAARLHGFRRTQKEIIQVVRICDVTLRKRLYEFEVTPSGDLTAEEFETLGIDLDDECDPPAFKKSKLNVLSSSSKRDLKKINKQDSLDLQISSTSVSSIDSQQLLHHTQEPIAHRPIGSQEEEVSNVPVQNETMESEGGEGGEGGEGEEETEEVELPPEDEIEKEMQEALNSSDFNSFHFNSSFIPPPHPPSPSPSPSTNNTISSSPSVSNSPFISSSIPTPMPIDSVPNAPINPKSKEINISPVLQKVNPVEKKEETEEIEEIETDINKYEDDKEIETDISKYVDDKEIEGYLNTEEEVQIKTELWEELHKEYMLLVAQRQKEKAIKFQNSQISQISQSTIDFNPNFSTELAPHKLEFLPGDEKPQEIATKAKKKRTSKENKPKTNSGRGKNNNSTSSTESTENISAAAATMEVLKKKVSTKINYSALEGLFSVDEKMFDPKTTRIHKVVSGSSDVVNNYSEL